MFQISTTIRTTDTPDGGILLDIHRGQMFSLNPVAARILHFMQQGLDEPQITEEISREYEVDKEIVRPDVLEFIEALGKHHILRPIRGPKAR